MKKTHHPATDLLGSFPFDCHPEPTPAQFEAFGIIEREQGSLTLEAPTGSGKTAIGITFLEAHLKQGVKHGFYVVPNKALVEQVRSLYPSAKMALGRNEHPCLYYEGEFKADEVPCSMLTTCPHRVDQQTGETHEPGAIPCPYLQQKYEAKSGGIIVCTTAFYLFAQCFGKEWGDDIALVVDEAHGIARTIRSVLSHEITDYHLERSVSLLESFNPEIAAGLDQFRKELMKIIKRKPAGSREILKPEEIERLVEALEAIDSKDLAETINEAVRSKTLNPKDDRELLKQLESLTRDLKRYYTALNYSMPSNKHQALNYSYAYYQKEKGENERVQYRLVIKSYFVVPLVKRMMVADKTLAMSATIGDDKVFAYDTGIDFPCYELESTFLADKARIFMPTDTPNLAVNKRSRQDRTKVLRVIAKSAKRFSKKGMRSLIVVVSNEERDKFVMLAGEEGLDVISYGNGVTAREAAVRFRAGEGDALVGTVANYGEGIDLPKDTAPVIYFLRPSYPHPADPATQYEERRFSGQRWVVWNWRAMIEVLQVRGRNIRSADDVGVCFLISQQFRRFSFGALPGWLQKSYRNTQTFEQCEKEALKLFK